MKSSIFLLLSPIIFIVLLIVIATVNGLGCDFKATRIIKNNGAEIEEYVLCKMGTLNVVTTESESGTRWSTNGRYFSFGKQILLVISSRGKLEDNKINIKSELDKEMYVNDNISLFHYALLPIDNYRMAFFQEKPTSDILMFDLDGDIDFWDAYVGYDKIYK